MANITENAREYVHKLRKDFKPDQRIDLTETLYYGSAVKVVNGKMNGTFSLSDLITKFRITANAFDINGRIGYKTQSIQSQKPFYISFDLPASLSIKDSIDIPVTVFNNLDQELSVTFEILNADPDLEAAMTEELSSVGPKSNFVKNIRITPKAIKDLTYLQIRATAVNDNMNLTDSLLQMTAVTPSGFPREQSNGGFIGTYSNQTASVPKSVEF